MTALLTKMKEYLKSNHKSELKDFKILVNSLYKKDKNDFYVYAPPMKTKNGKEATINYIIRYCGRPAMSQNRITNYDDVNKTIDYYYEDHKTNERIDVHENVIDFIKKLVQHIPEKQFKMVRYYGIYATCDRSRFKKRVKLLINKLNAKSKCSNIYQTQKYKKRINICFQYLSFIV